MSNYEKIKSMTLNEIADFICNSQSGCTSCRFYVDCLKNKNMGIGMIHYLEEDASESK